METEAINFFLTDPADSYAVRSGSIKLPETRTKRVDDGLPPILNAADLLSNPKIVTPPELIHGVLHKGLKCILGSTSKANKTWILLDLALSVASGSKWWNWDTTKGKVLFVNFEIPESFLRDRIRALAAKKENPDTGNLDIWTLRGHAAPFSELMPKIIQQVQNKRYYLIIVDPIYKGLGGQDENKAGDIAGICNEFEKLAVQTDAAIVYAHHFSKGNQANRESIDRFSGSGVFARDADAIIALTPHEKENCFGVDVTLRNFIGIRSFVMEWEFPLMKMRPDLRAIDLKGRPGRPAQDHTPSLIELLTKKPLTTTAWEKLAKKELNISKASFHRALKEMKVQNKIIQGKNKKWSPTEE